MVFCQRCQKKNPSGRQECHECGAPLFLITPHRSIRHEYASGNTIEEHLLERLSFLENQHLGLLERFERLCGIVERQATLIGRSQEVIDKLLGLLVDSGVLDAPPASHPERPLPPTVSTPPALQIEPAVSLSEHIVANFHGRRTRHSRFSRLVADGFDRLTKGDEAGGIARLHEASELDPTNTELSFLIASHHFRANEWREAEAALKQTLAHAPEHFEALLMMGAVSAECGNAGEAYDFLTRTLKQQKNCFAALYILGRLLAAEGSMKQALTYLNRALDINPSPEMHYLVGHAHLKRGHQALALKHLRRAVELDPRFDAALYHLGLIYLKRGNIAQARLQFQAAYDINPISSYRTALRARDGAALPLFPPFEKSRIARRKIVSSGDERLAKMLSDALSKVGSQK